MKGISPGLECKVSVRKIDPPDRLSFFGPKRASDLVYGASFRIPGGQKSRSEMLRLPRVTNT